MNSYFKRIIAGIISILLTLNMVVVATMGKSIKSSDNNNKTKSVLSVYVNNKTLKSTKVNPYKSGKGFLVPAKKFAKLLKVKYRYKKSVKLVILKKKSKKMYLTINKKKAVFKKKNIRLKVKTRLKSGTPMLDAVTIAKKFGYKYSKYFKSSNALVVANKKKYLKTPATISSPEVTALPIPDATSTITLETSSPNITNTPAVSPKPTDTTSMKPDTTTTPEVTQKPVVSNTPDTTSETSVTPEPQATVIPTIVTVLESMYSQNFEDGSTLFTDFYGDTLPTQNNVSDGANGTKNSLSLSGYWATCRSFPSMTLQTNTDYKISFYIKGCVYQVLLIMPDDTRHLICNYENAPEITTWRKIEFSFSTGNELGTERDFEFRLVTGDGTAYLDELNIGIESKQTNLVTFTPTPSPTPRYTPAPSTGPYPSISIDPNGGKAGTTYAYRTTGLPVCYINTNDKTNPSKKGVYQEGVMCIEDTGDSGIRLLQPLNIEIAVRGNSTSGASKKPYNIKFMNKDDGSKNKQSVLGMTEHHKWSLLAGAYDKSLLRNAVALNFASQLSGLDFTPDFRFVDVVLNGEYIGNYMLTERIEIAKARIDIEKENATGDKFGYVVEWDQRSAQEWANQELGWDYFLVNLPSEGNVAFAYKDPEKDDFLEDANSTRRTYIANDVTTTWEKIFTASDSNTEFLDYIDIDSFIDYYMVQELIMPVDGYNFSSIYMYKDCADGAKMHMGPAWDYDLSLGNTNPGQISSIYYRSAAYCSPLKNHSATNQKYKNRWIEIQPIAAEMLNYIDTTAQEIKASAELNYKKWSISSVDIYDGTTIFTSYDDAVASLKNLYQARYNAMNDSLTSWW